MWTQDEIRAATTRDESMAALIVAAINVQEWPVLVTGDGYAPNNRNGEPAPLVVVAGHRTLREEFTLRQWWRYEWVSCELVQACGWSSLVHGLNRPPSECRDSVVLKVIDRVTQRRLWERADAPRAGCMLYPTSVHAGESRE